MPGWDKQCRVDAAKFGCDGKESRLQIKPGRAATMTNDYKRYGRTAFGIRNGDELAAQRGGAGVTLASQRLIETGTCRVTKNEGWTLLRWDRDRMKLSTKAGLVGFVLALCGIEPGPAAAGAPNTPIARADATIDSRLTKITEALRTREATTGIEGSEPVLVAAAFLNSAPSFRNHVSGWRNGYPYWVNSGTFHNSGAHFLNNASGFRNSVSGWRNSIPGWVNGGGFRNSGSFKNSGGSFKNSGGGFRNGGGFYNR